MTIDWIKAEEKLDKKQAVEGRDLLELRNKSDNLREKLKEAKDKLEETNKNLFQIKEKFHLLSEDHEKSKATNRRDIEKKEEICNNLNIEIEEVKIELEKSNSEVSELEFLLKEKEQKILQITKSSGSEISRITSELEEASGKILEVENNLNRAISNSIAKDEEIRRLNGIIKELDTENNNLEAQLKNLDEQKDSEIQNLESAVSEQTKLVKGQSLHIDELEKDLESFKPPEVEESAYSPSYENRIICPKCEARGKNVRTVNDRKKVLSWYDNKPMYAKKYVCIKCNYDWPK